MKKITRIILSGILLICISCKSEFTSPELEKNFTSSQISDFKTITEFFTEQICQNNEESDFKNCFENILPELVEHGWNPILENVAFEKQKEMYQSITKSTFNEIWGYSKMWKYQDKTEFKSIGININGKYLAYLQNVGDKSKYIADYTEGIYTAGDVESMGLLQNHIFKNPNDLDLNDVNIQILIAVHYLTQNDHEKRVENWNDK